MFVSQIPNSDPEPYYVEDDYGHRIHVDGWFALDDTATFDPRPEFDHTRDPEPWAFQGVRASVRPSGDWRWAPRREQFDVPVNRVLEAFRGIEADEPGSAAYYLDSMRQNAPLFHRDFTTEEIDHARRVLSKLANVYGA